MSNQRSKKEVAVIGSGFGGLAVAIRLQAKGYQVSLFEKRDLPGGRAYVFKDKGFTFDAGPTVITAPDCIHELFECAGKKTEDYVKLLPVKPFYRLYWEDGYTFDYDNDSEMTYDQIRKKRPGDVEGYKRFLEYSKEVFHEGYTKLVHVPFLTVWSMLRVAPQLIKLGAYRSVYSVVSSFVKDPQLRQAFSFHSLLVGGNPFSSSAIYTLIHYLERNWGVFFAKGGTGALVQGLVKCFKDIGGKIYLSTEIDEILTEVKDEKRKITGIKTKEGETFPFSVVVTNAEVLHTYKDLLKNDFAAQKKTERLKKQRFSMSLFLIYFGTNKKYENLTHHNVMFGPRYKELLADIFEKGVLSDDFSLYLHAPCRTDASMAPNGCDTFYVLSPVPHLGKSDIDWDVEGPVYAQKILKYLEKYYMPDLTKHIVTQRLFTPKGFEKELNSCFGSAFSLEPTLLQSAYFRIHNRDPKISGLYFVGAGTHPGAGVPGVINSGKATAGVVLEHLEQRSEVRGNESLTPSEA